jgi:hypothetical protein
VAKALVEKAYPFKQKHLFPEKTGCALRTGGLHVQIVETGT